MAIGVISALVADGDDAEALVLENCYDLLHSARGDVGHARRLAGAVPRARAPRYSLRP